MLNKAMLLPAGGSHLARIAVRALIYVDYNDRTPPEEDEWEWLNGWSSSLELDGRPFSLEAAEFLRVKECPGAHLVLKKITKNGKLKALGFNFVIEPDVAGDVGAVSKLQEFLASKRLRPVLFDKNLKVKLPRNASIHCQDKNKVFFNFRGSTGWQGDLYQGIEERPAGSREYYLQLECYVGLTR